MSFGRIKILYSKVMILLRMIGKPNLTIGLYHMYKLNDSGMCFARYRDQIIYYANKPLLKWLEYSQEELSSINFFSLIHSEDLERTLAKAKELKLNETDPVIGFVNRYRTKSGKYVTLKWTTYVIWGWYVAEVEKL